MFNKKHIKGEDSEITLTNNEIKDIMKVIKSLGDRGILLKVTTEKVVNQKKEGFIYSLVRVGLPLMNSHHQLKIFCCYWE